MFYLSSKKHLGGNPIKSFTLLRSASQFCPHSTWAVFWVVSWALGRSVCFCIEEEEVVSQDGKPVSQWMTMVKHGGGWKVYVERDLGGHVQGEGF